MLGCTVYANDINPECYKWMNVNLKKNQPKKSPQEYHVWNLDGREFLRTIAFPRIEQYQQDMNNRVEHRKIIILMNLPAIALTFLDVVSTWLYNDIDMKQQWQIPVHIYCYTFSRAENCDDDIRSQLRCIAPNITTEQISCRFVRQVAPNKDMMCVRIVLFAHEKVSQVTMPVNKHEINDEKTKRFKRDDSQ
jgi:tRNA (guanine37-N1)-methyltransferase